jgi:tetratricopeptide (TPR) repeat protein
MFQGDYQEASARMHEVLAIDSSLYGSSHPFLAMHLENMAMIYDYRGFPDSNVMMLNQTLAMRRAVLPEDSPDIGRTLFNLGSAEYRRGKYEAAEPLYEESLARMRRAYGPLHPDVVWATASLGRNQYRLGRRAEAERNLRWALGVTDPDGRLDPPAVARAGQELVALYLEQRRWAEAEPLALRVLAIRDSIGDTLARRSAAQLAEIYKGKGRHDLAAEYQKRASPMSP